MFPHTHSLIIFGKGGKVIRWRKDTLQQKILKQTDIHIQKI